MGAKSLHYVEQTLRARKKCIPLRLSKGTHLPKKNNRPQTCALNLFSGSIGLNCPCTTHRRDTDSNIGRSPVLSHPAEPRLHYRLGILAVRPLNHPRQHLGPGRTFVTRAHKEGRLEYEVDMPLFKVRQRLEFDQAVHFAGRPRIVPWRSACSEDDGSGRLFQDDEVVGDVSAFIVLAVQ